MKRAEKKTIKTKIRNKKLAIKEQEKKRRKLSVENEKKGRNKTSVKMIEEGKTLRKKGRKKVSTWNYKKKKEENIIERIYK